MRRLLILLIAVQAVATVAEAQSLGEVARKEEARRKAVTSSGKVYTNENLRSDGSTPAPAAAAAPAAAPAATEPDKAAATPAETPDAKKDEASWRNRIKSERDALARAQIFAESLQSRINALTADFSARDDPYQRNQIGQDRQKALAELDRVRKEIAEHTKAISDIQEAARKAGVPVGWVR
jgi:chromosome segregation ATPase